ncbi:MAG: AraC family transcriptional regulator [Bilifractor sp.]
MNEYKHLRAHFFDKTSSTKLREYAEAGKKDIKAGDFFLQGRIFSLPYTPVLQPYRDHVLYLQQYALMDMGPAFFTHRKNYDSFLILFTISGSGQLTYQGKDYALDIGDGFLINCQDEHAYRAKENGWKHIILHFNGKEAPFLYQMYSSEGSPLFHFTQAEHVLKLFEEVVDSVCSIHSNREWKTSMLIQSLLLQISEHKTDIQRTDETKDNIRYLCKYMENHFSENLTLTDLACFCGYDPSYLCRVFKRETGYSPKEYMTILRLEQAKELLGSTSIPVYKIGLLIGIPDETNFTRLFKKYMHDTPGEFRKRTR